MKQGTVSISWGEYGGFYFYRGYSTRLCLGWVAFTYIPSDIDTILHNPEEYYNQINSKNIKDERKNRTFNSRT